jgi:integrase/recombinase XerD
MPLQTGKHPRVSPRAPHAANAVGIIRQSALCRLCRSRHNRHSYAVHRLTEWYRQGADVQKLLPQLSVYLGHSCLAYTQVYLSMTPELLQQAGARFERYACQEDDHD